MALSKDGAVYTWGKGDYHRLGHGTDEHVRRPRKVQALAGKRIVSLATGSLHCVACTDQGDTSKSLSKCFGHRAEFKDLSSYNE